MDNTLLVAVVGFLGVLVGSITSGIVNYYMKKSTQNHEIAKLDLENTKARKDFLSSRFEEFTMKIYGFKRHVEYVILDALEITENIGTPDVFTPLELEIRTLSILYFTELETECQEFIDFATSLTGYAISYKKDEEKNNEARQTILKELDEFYEVFSFLIEALKEHKEKFI